MGHSIIDFLKKDKPNLNSTKKNRIKRSFGEVLTENDVILRMNEESDKKQQLKEQKLTNFETKNRKKMENENKIKFFKFFYFKNYISILKI